MAGPLAVASIRELGFSKAFVGVSGYTPEAGFTLNDSARAEVTWAILDRGAENYILTNSSKFGLAHTSTVCNDLRVLHAVITDAGIPEAHRQAIEAAGVGVLS